MTKLLSLLLITVFFIIGCDSSNEKNKDQIEITDSTDVEVYVADSIDKKIVSNYDMSTVDKKNTKEFKESLVKIEKEYGVQWGFCDCVVKGDSINKAFQKNNISDKEFSRLEKRLDQIDEHCQAFRIQDPNATPDERAEHEKKVRKCLKQAGIKN